MLINFDSKRVEYRNPSLNGLIKTDVLKPKSAWENTIDTHTIEFFGDGNIGYLTDVISPSMCNLIIHTAVRNGQWQKATTTGEIDGKVSKEDSARQNSLCQISGMSYTDFPDMDRFIHLAYTAALDKYLHELGVSGAADAGLTQDEGYQMLRYEPGNFYKEHIDYSSAAGLIRVVSGLIYLNDDYEGGEIYFPRFDVKIKPKAGSIVFFPSSFTHLHTSLPVKEGIKTCIVSWWK